MALLFIDSCDHYNSAHLLAKWTSSATIPSVVTGLGRCDSNCLRMSTFNTLQKGLPFASTTGTVGFAMLVIGADTLANAEINIGRFYGSNSSPHLRLWYFAVDGSLAVYRTSGTGTDVLLGRTVPDVVREDSYYFIEWQATIHATAGSVTVRVNNVVVLTLSGINTVGSDGATPFPADLRAIGFSCGSNQQWLLDDVYALDSTGAAPWNTFLGDCRVEYLRPRAAGTAQQWDLIGAASHWQAVDDAAIPDDDTSYLTTTVANEIDTQLYQPTGLPSGPIFGAQLSLLARKTDSGPRELAPVIRQGGADQVGASQAPSATDYHYLIQTYPVNPHTGAAWTIAEINADEYGVKVTA